MKKNRQVRTSFSEIYKNKSQTVTGWKEELNKKAQEVSKTPINQGLIIMVVLNLLIIALVLLLQKLLPPEVPLYFGLPEGEQQLVGSHFLIIPSTLSLFLVIVNTLISLVIKNDFLIKVLTVASYATTFFSAIATIKIFLLVGGL